MNQQTIMPRLILIAVMAGVCLAQNSSDFQGQPLDRNDARLLVLESKVSDLQVSLKDVSAKLDAVNLQLTSLNTKMSLIQWIGASLGVLLLGTIWKLISERPTNPNPQTGPPSSSAPHDLVDVLTQLAANKLKEQNQAKPAAQDQPLTRSQAA